MVEVGEVEAIITNENILEPLLKVVAINNLQVAAAEEEVAEAAAEVEAAMQDKINELARLIKCLVIKNLPAVAEAAEEVAAAEAEAVAAEEVAVAM